LAADTLYDGVAAFETVNEIPEANVGIKWVFLAETESEISSLWQETSQREDE
jgi:hypothetical protein